MTLDERSTRYLLSQVRGHLATVGPAGTPQNKPVGFTYNAELETIDIAGIDMEASAKYRNLDVHPDVAFVVDDVVSTTAGAAGTRFLEIRGWAEAATVTSGAAAGSSSRIIRIHPRRTISWNLYPDHPGLHTRDLRPIPRTPQVSDSSLDGELEETGAPLDDLVHIDNEVGPELH
jgi:pyridoxamine 5'-phosphate oxidase family protein